MGMGPAVYLGMWLILAGAPVGEQAAIALNSRHAELVWTITGNAGGAAFGSLRDGGDLEGRSAWMVTAPGANGTEADYVMSKTGAWLGNGTDGASGAEIGSLRFLFYAGAGGEVDFPAGLNVCIRVAAEPHSWNFTVPPSELKPGWNRVTVPIDPAGPGQWWSPSRDEEHWAADIASVKAAGIWLAYQSGAQYASQTYGIADFVWD